MKHNTKFDIESAVQALREGNNLCGQNGILTPLIKRLTGAAMQAELEDHLLSEAPPNRTNGSTLKP